MIAGDAAGAVTFINPVAMALTGWGEEATGTPLGALRFSFGRPRKITEEERVFLEALAGPDPRKVSP